MVYRQFYLIPVFFLYSVCVSLTNSSSLCIFRMIPLDLFLIARKTTEKSVRSSEDDSYVLYIAFCMVIVVFLLFILFILFYSTGWWSKLFSKLNQQKNYQENIVGAIENPSRDIAVQFTEETVPNESVYHVDLMHNNSYRQPIMSIPIIPTLPAETYVFNDADTDNNYVYVSFVTHQYFVCCNHLFSFSFFIFSLLLFRYFKVMSEEEAIITTEGDAKVDEEPIEIINAEEEVEEEEEEGEEYSEEEYIQATRYSFEIKPDHYIFDFKEFESEDEEIEEEEEEMEDEGDLDDEDDNDKDGMEEDGPIDEEMTDQQRVCVILLVDV